MRLTGQVTPKNRVTFSYQPQYRCLGSTLTTNADGCRVREDDWIGSPFGAETIAPEAGPGYQDGPVSLTQATWTSPVSSRHLVDAAVSRFWYGIIGSGHVPPDSPMGFIGVTETSNIYGRANVRIARPYGWGEYDTVSWNWRASWSYVTGGHSAKMGYTGTEMKYDWVNYTNPSLMRYTFNSPRRDHHAWSKMAGGCARPSVNYTITEDFENANRAVAHSIFLQDQWTRGRMTLQGALRWDYVYSWAPAEGNGTDRRAASPRRPIRFPRRRACPAINDLSPRIGLAYDLFGNGRTALKASVGKLSVGGDGRRHLLLAEPGPATSSGRHEPCVDRLERQLRRRLQSAESGRAGHQRDRRRYLRRADRRKPELRQHRSEYDESRSRRS